jgi:hypothetical protein
MNGPKKPKKGIDLRIMLAVILIAFIILAAASMISESKKITENDAIRILKEKYPEFKDYPNYKLIPQVIQTESSREGLYVAFVQEGSGRPILYATCFFVKNDGATSKVGEYLPKIGEDKMSFSLKTCS